MITKPLRYSVSVLALASGLALAGCETTSTNAPGSASANAGASELPAAPLADDPLSQAAYWGARYEEEPESIELAIRYSASLRQLGSLEEASLFMSRVSSEHPNNADIFAELAKIFVEARRGEEALAPLGRAIALRSDDWRLFSLEGVAYDQMGDYDRATTSYERAMQLSSNNPAILNNYGLSRALAGDLEGAEIMLEAAVGLPEASAQSRQNLALVKGLQGDFNEAERLARADLSPDAVNNNMAYYRSVLTQPAAWSDFESTPEEPTPLRNPE